MRTTGRDAEMLARLEPRLRTALEVVGARLAAIDSGAPCDSADAAYCEGFCDALRYLFGTDPEARQLMEEVVGRLGDTPSEGEAVPGEDAA